jgi:acyl dehydratase
MSASLPAPETTPPITMAQVMDFAAASGDSNLVHLSEEAARAAGLAGPVLHGMIVAGRFEMFVERMHGYEIAELQVRFIRPVPVGSALTIAARPLDVSGPQHHIRLLATIEGVLVAIAEARLAPPSYPTE